MKWIFSICWVLLVTAFGWLPFKGSDIATLEPAEILYVSQEGDVFMETEAGWYGKGMTVEKAIADLKASSPGQVFLQTVDYLLVQEKDRELLPDLISQLRSGCMICLVEEKPDLQKALAYLQAHNPDFTLRDVCAGKKNIPILSMEEERAYLEK